SSIHSCVVVAMSVLLGGIRRAIGLLLRRHVGLVVIFSRRLCLRLSLVRRSGPGGRLLGCLGLGLRRWSLDIGPGRLGGGGLGLRGGLLGGLRVLRGLGLGLGGGGLRGGLWLLRGGGLWLLRGGGLSLGGGGLGLGGRVLRGGLGLLRGRGLGLGG